MDNKNFHEFGYRKMNILLKNDDLNPIETKKMSSFACLVIKMSRVIDVSTTKMKIDAMFWQIVGHGAEYAIGRG